MRGGGVVRGRDGRVSATPARCGRGPLDQRMWDVASVDASAPPPLQRSCIRRWALAEVTGNLADIGHGQRHHIRPIESVEVQGLVARERSA